MRKYRPNRSVFVCAALLCTIVLIHKFTNVSELCMYFMYQERHTLPLSMQCNLGRLGNQMCTYASLYGLTKLNRRRFLPLSCNTMQLKDVFEGPSQVQSLHNILYVRWNAWRISPDLKPLDKTIPSNSNFINGYLYPCSYTFFDHARDNIRREFRFQGHLRQHAQDVLSKANVNNLPSVTYVGLHVRRGDYRKDWLDVFQGAPVNMEYFRRAVKYFRDKYENVRIIGISDDRLWCINELSAELGVYVPEEAPSPAHDLAVLASCNHTIVTYGTFGFWGAYLAGGEVVYFDKFLKPNSTFMMQEFSFDKMYPPHWKGIVTVNSSYWSRDEQMTTHKDIGTHWQTREKALRSMPRDESQRSLS